MAVLYRHIRLDSNQPFYIGIGQDEKRAYSKDGRNKHWHGVVNKHGYKVQIMLDDLTWEEACEKEREFIQLYGRKDLGKGGLVNKTDGGDGVVGKVISKETKVKLSIAGKGRVISEEQKAKLRAAMIGRVISEETKAKLSAANTGKKHTEEARANMIAAKRASSYNCSAEARAKMSAAAKGKPKSEEHKAKIGATLTGKKQSAETKAKRVATLKANGSYNWSEETIAKRAATRKANYAKKRMENG